MTLPKITPTGRSMVQDLFMILLTCGLIATVAINVFQDKEQERKINYVWADYMPMMFLETMTKNSNYQTQELLNKMSEMIADMKGDKELVEKYKKESRVINEKYMDFQKMTLDNMIKMKGGMTNITRSIKVSGDTGASNSD
jgi:hypothetical protein